MTSQIAFVLASTAHGMMIVPRNDRVEVEGGAYGVGGEILATGSYQIEEVVNLQRMLNVRRSRFGDGVVMLDVGANIGALTLVCARHMGGWGEVLAFEPQQRLFYALAGNIVMNNLDNAHAYLFAVGSKSGSIRVPMLDFGRPGSYGSLDLLGVNNDLGQEVGEDTRWTEVVMVRLDDQFVDYPRLDLVKVDVEGMEVDVLGGALACIQRHKPILWVEHTKSNRAMLEALLEGISYEFLEMGMNLACVPKGSDYFKVKDPVTGTVAAGGSVSDLAKLNESVRLGDAGQAGEAISLLLASNMCEVDHPLHYQCCLNLGTLWMQIGRMKQAVTVYREVADNAPDEELRKLARFSIGFAHLKTGNLRAGFEGFEDRKKPDIPPALAAIPMLTRDHLDEHDDGTKAVRPVRGKTVLVLGEMGFGDNIMFARYLDMLVEEGAHVVAAVPPQLGPLLARMPKIQVHTEHSPRPDLWCHMMSLAHVFRTDLDTVPAPAVFDLPADHLARWRAATQLSSSVGRLKVGLCWSGSRKSQYDAHRSIPLGDLLPLADVPGVDFYNLTLDVREDDKAAYVECTNMFAMADKFHNFFDTACAIKALDLVISVDTSVAHLAGTLGVPTWVMLTSFRTYWAWIDGSDSSPWYPSTRAFRQDRDGDWGGLVGRVKEELRTFMLSSSAAKHSPATDAEGRRLLS